MANSKILQFERVDKESIRALAAEKDLVKKAAAGNREAFQSIVETNKQRMFTVAKSVIHDGNIAEDVVQESFIKAYRSLDSFRGDSKLSTWLHRITYLTAIDFRRQQARQLTVTDDGLEVEAVDSHPNALSDSELTSHQMKNRINAALASLSDFEQSVFTLRHMQNFKLREIAVVLDRSEGTVKNILFRAIRKLRDQLDDVATAHQESGKP